VFLHQEGVFTGENPLGEIEAVTDAQGNFRIDALKPGSYVFRAVSVGYVTARTNLVVSAGENAAGTVTLVKGATVSGSITKPDGSSPTRDEVRMVVGVDRNFTEFVFGRVDSNADTDLVTGYSLTGFKPGLAYSIVILTGSDDILEAKSNLTFASAGEQRTVNLSFRPSPPAVFVTQERTGGRVTARFLSSHKLRNLTDDDNDLSKIVTRAAGAGVLVSAEISPSRDTVTVVYDLPANESSFKLRLAFASVHTDPESASGDNFVFDREFQFFAGVGRMRRVRIPNVTGGSALMEGVPAGVNFSAGAFDVESSSRVEVSLFSALDLDSLATASPSKGPGAYAQGVAGAARRLGPAAYPVADLYKAAQLAPSVSPFSAFYDIFLPAGVSRSLKKEALLTLRYDESADPSKINVYYFDEGNNVFLLEAAKRKVDAKNKTITVAINHASTFVVLANNAPTVGASTYAGTEVLLYNFPNPFSLKSKTVDLASAPGAPALSTEGTVIKYALPPGKSGAVKIEIYNVAGELVRVISENAPSGGTYYYTAWDGRNDGGKKAASGVYIARFTLNGGDEKFHKMAIIK
jgi:hypothetical protein